LSAEVPGPEAVAAPEGPGLAKLAAPILAENLVRASLIAVDQLMLYAFSTAAAASMSASSQLAFFLQLLYQMPAQGAAILVARSLGAGRREEAERFALGGLALVGLVSLLASLAYATGSGALLSLFDLEPGVRAGSRTFLAIYGGASLFMALNISLGSVLRAFGHTHDVMSATIAALACTIVGNYLALFGPFGLPVMGLAGVAVSNVAGQLVALLVLMAALRRRRISLPLGAVPTLPRPVLRGILAIGLPTTGENISYNLSQVAVVAIVSGLGTASLAAYGLVIALTRYVFIFGVSVGIGAQIRVGWLVGAGRADEAGRAMYRWFGVAASVAFGLALLLNLVKVPLIGLFTRDPVIAPLVALVLLVSIAYEPGRCFNTVVIPGLKGAGDVGFPVFVGILFMWGVSVLGSWLLGRVAGLGLLGVWIAMGTDEWTRGLVMFARWRGGRWKTAFARREGQ